MTLDELEALAQECVEELEKTAGVKEMGGKVLGALKRGGQGAMGMAKRYGELMKGGKKGEFGDLKGRRAGNSLKGLKQWRSEAGKSLAARAGTAAAVAGGGYAAKKKLDK